MKLSALAQHHFCKQEIISKQKLKKTVDRPQNKTKSKLAKLRKEIKEKIKFGALVAQLVKNLPAMWETWVQSLEWEDPLKKGKATHSSILAWRISWTIQSQSCT